MKSFSKYILVLILIIFISGCKKIDKETQTLPRQTPVIKKDEELEKWREEVKKEVYTIDFAQLQNPFITPKTYKLLSKKEEFIALELVGILIKGNKKYALLQDATKKGYIVKVGDKLGKSTIKEISGDYILIEEWEENIFGSPSKKIKKITLKRGEK
ncbi:MAG: pilus assembly protein PilP [Caldimicrobium sp.]